ncbi:MAG: hypothetical protein RL095_587 [Verrucomicrobiota bacterium]|jgi:uncharacterized protein YbbC (DUF1343 family)
MRLILLLLLLPLALLAQSSAPARPAAVKKPAVKPGIEVLLEHRLDLIRGKRVGLMTNQTGVDSKRRRTLDLLAARRDMKLTALFACEHGIRGDLPAGTVVPGGRDKRTGLPVYSLYGGDDRRPKKVLLDKVDVVIYDIQDTGSRSYTYIWSMAEMIAACGQHGKHLIVLDRPDIFGGLVVDGAVREEAYKSFIGLYPVPKVYGMTCGELARYLNTEYRLKCNLTVVPMSGWRRGMTWEETGLPWVPTSPKITTVRASQCFAATGGIGVLGGVLNIGMPGNTPFQCVAAPWIDARRMAAELNAQKLPGITFVATSYKSGAYMQYGVTLKITQASRFMPARTEVAILAWVRRNYPRQPLFEPRFHNIFDKANGTSSIRTRLARGESWQQVAKSWEPALSQFKARRGKYLIYR